MGRLILTILFILFCEEASALLPAPPIMKEENWQINQYLKELYDNHNVIKGVDVVPSGVIFGRKNEIVIYNYSTGPSLWINVDGDKLWRQIN